jgi:hypothetical protein
VVPDKGVLPQTQSSRFVDKSARKFFLGFSHHFCKQKSGSLVPKGGAKLGKAVGNL